MQFFTEIREFQGNSQGNFFLPSAMSVMRAKKKSSLVRWIYARLAGPVHVTCRGGCPSFLFRKSDRPFRGLESSSSHRGSLPRVEYGASSLGLQFNKRHGRRCSFGSPIGLSTRRVSQLSHKHLWLLLGLLSARSIPLSTSADKHLIFIQFNFISHFGGSKSWGSPYRL